MKDPYNTGSDLDARLEQVIESHRETPTKQASEEPSKGGGLLAYAGRPSISDEIASIGAKTASYDLNTEIAGDMMDRIVESRREKLAAFHEAVREAASTPADPVKVATDLIRSGVDPQEAARRALA